MDIIRSSNGLLSGGDYISLSDSLYIENNYLIDSANNAKHELSSKAQFAVINLINKVSVDKWLETVKLSDEEKVELLTFLNNIGALDIERSIIQTKRIFTYKLKLILFGIRPSSNTIRLKAGFYNLILLILRSMTSLILGIIFTSVILYGAGLSAGFLGLIISTFILLVFVSTVIHEGAHVLIARLHKSNPYLLQKGLRIGVLHGNIGNRLEFYSAILSPLAGLVSSVVIGYLTYFVIGNVNIIYLSYLVGSFHLFSLLPTYGDGKTILNLLRKYRYAQAT